MKPRVLAIGLDSFGYPLLECWLAKGCLPHLAALRKRGALGRLHGRVRYNGQVAPLKATEPLWTVFQAGLSPDVTGYWSAIHYDPIRYEATSDPISGGYDYADHKPFFALGPEFPVIAFDVPVSRLCEDVHGLQVLGWGGHAPFVRSESKPAGLLGEIVRKHGRDELLHKDHGEFWNERYLRWLVRAGIATAKKRSAICRDLMRHHPWSLFVTAFGETHSAAHDLWFRSEAGEPGAQTPVADAPGSPERQDPMLRVYQAVDRAVGEIVADATADTFVLCFSLHGMGANASDVASMALLPEFLYRWNFPGRIGLAPDDPNAPVTGNVRDFWGAEVWRRRWEPNRVRRFLKSLLPAWAVGPGEESDLESPYQVGCDPPNLGWMPASWYRRLWPRMKAFAVPTFLDGQVRINVLGRDGHGVVEPHQYEASCAEVTAALERLRHGRTGEPVVKHVYRTRRSANDTSVKAPPGDLIVVWHDEPVDVIDSPDVGRIGPLPYYRTGGHHNQGFLLACGPGIRENTTLPDGETVDLAPTILRLMEAPASNQLPGSCLIDAAVGYLVRL